MDEERGEYFSDQGNGAYRKAFLCHGRLIEVVRTHDGRYNVWLDRDVGIQGDDLMTEAEYDKLIAKIRDRLDFNPDWGGEQEDCQKEQEFRERQAQMFRNSRPSTSSGGNFCFVATATFGSNDHSQVKLLQEFRDNWLLRQRGGCQLVRLYYRMSPSVADIIRKSALLKAVSRSLIIAPVCFIAKRLLNKNNKTQSKSWPR